MEELCLTLTQWRQNNKHITATPFSSSTSKPNAKTLGPGLEPAQSAPTRCPLSGARLSKMNCLFFTFCDFQFILLLICDE